MEPSSTHSCERSKARKTGAQLRESRRSTKKWRKMRRKPLHRHHNQHGWKSSTLLCCTTRCPLTLAMNESEAPLLLKRTNLSLHDHRASIAAESGTNTTCTTRTSATITTRDNCGTTAVFCTLNHGHLSLNTTRMSTTLSRLQRLATRLSPTALHVQDDDHLINVLQLENLRNGPEESATAPRQGVSTTSPQSLRT